jgi:hypothetical protein
MSSQTFTDMSNTDFEQLINGYINRAADQADRIPTDLFFDLLLKRIAASSGEAVTLVVAVNNDEVVITPDREVSDLVVRGNEIFIGGRCLVVKLVHQSGSNETQTP